MRNMSYFFVYIDFRLATMMINLQSYLVGEKELNITDEMSKNNTVWSGNPLTLTTMILLKV